MEWIFVIQITIVIIAIFLFTSLLKIFNIKRSIYYVVIFPICLFSVGFSLRVSEIQKLIDVGFFMTDFSFLFIYSVTALALTLGQLKYWKKN
jgi:hypothetical protein